MSLDYLAVYSEGKKSGSALKRPVIWTLVLDVFIKLPPSWELPMSLLLPTGESHRSWGSSWAGHVLFPSPPSWVKVTFSQPLSRPAFPILGLFSQLPGVFFLLLFQENNPLVWVTLACPLGEHYCRQADVKIYVSACLILVTERFSQVSDLPWEHLCNQWCTQRRAFSWCTGTLCWAEADSAK